MPGGIWHAGGMHSWNASSKNSCTNAAVENIKKNSGAFRSRSMQIKITTQLSLQNLRTMRFGIHFVDNVRYHAVFVYYVSFSQGPHVFLAV